MRQRWEDKATPKWVKLDKERQVLMLPLLNTNALDCLKEMAEKFYGPGGEKKLHPEDDYFFYIATLADCVVWDWVGFALDGQVVEYTPGNAFLYFMQQQNAPTLKLVMEAGKKRRTFR